jgi:hypothetical protein
MTRDNQSPNLDEWLATFTDQALDGRAHDMSAVGLDPELCALAETVLRLKNAFPKEEMSPVVVKRQYDRILVRWRNERQKRTPWEDFFRLEWLSLPQRRLATAAAWAVAAVILVVALPILFPNGPLPAFAGDDPLMAPQFWILLGFLVVLFFLSLPRK